MLYKMTKAIQAELSRQEGLKVFTEEHEGSSCVWLSFGIDGGGHYRINFISHDNDKDVAVRVYGLITVKENQREKMLAALNIINKKYRYLKFVLDDDGDVSIHYDYLLTDADPAESVTELTTRITQIVDDAYPMLMRTMWAE